MSSKWLVVGCTLWTLGCATNETVKNEGLDSPSEPPAAAEQVQKKEAPSEVLNKNEGKVKCPKNAKLVNGKCLLQVESND